MANERSRYDMRGAPEHGVARVREIAHALGFRKGRHTAAVMGRASAYKIRKIPFGIFMLDWYTHGGLPVDRITRLYGPRNSCKTTLMLKVLAISQGYCRMCKCPIVADPETGDKNCACPSRRFKPSDTAVLEHLEQDEVVSVMAGNLPKAAKKGKGDPYVEIKGRRFTFEETYRCTPLQAVFIETEHKLDEMWAARNGVNTDLVFIVGSDWAESTLDTVEALLYSGEVDLVLVDTVSMLVPKEKITKDMEATPRVAVRANIIQRFLEKIIAAQYHRGLYNDKPVTILINSQVRTKGIGSYHPFQDASDGNAMEHATTLDIKLRAAGYKWLHKEYASYGQYEFTVVKNHAGGSSGVSGSFQMWLDPKGPLAVGDTDDVEQAIKFGRQSGLISEDPKYTVKAGSFSRKFKTLADITSFFRDNRSVYAEYRRHVLEYMITVRTAVKEKESD